jgi:glycosyltransferase involved in cell wall biosynthesis
MACHPMSTSMRGSVDVDTFWPMVSVLVPAYDAEDTIERLLQSLMTIDYPWFECVVVDDGSRDGTGRICQEFEAGDRFEFRYCRRPHGGKARALNFGAAVCRGELIMIVDADDALPPRALTILVEAWNQIPEAERERFAAVEGHCVDMKYGRRIGSSFPSDVFDSNHIHTRYRLGIRGDKKRLVRRSVLLETTFPEIDGEDFVPMSYVWNEIGLRYHCRYVNADIYLADYRPSGITANRPGIAVRNPKGALKYYIRLCEVLEVARGIPLSKRLRAGANVARYSLHAGLNPWKTIVQHVRDPWVRAPAFGLGLVTWVSDKRGAGNGSG